MASPQRRLDIRALCQLLYEESGEGVACSRRIDCLDLEDVLEDLLLLRHSTRLRQSERQHEGRIRIRLMQSVQRMFRVIVAP